MSLFGTDGIRARAGTPPLDSAGVRRIGRAVGRLLKDSPDCFRVAVPEWLARRYPADPASPPRVLIGRDPRLSGPSLEADLLAGLSSAGIAAVLAGVLPTPAVAQLVRLRRCALGIVLSASHNPPEDNGIKILSPEGFKIPDAAEARIEALGKEGAAPASSARTDSADLADEYLAVLQNLVVPPDFLSGLRVVVDCAYGATAGLASGLLRRLGVEVAALHDRPDGALINVNCGATDLAPLTRGVLERGADAGIAFDGDGDRALFSDERGRPVDGDQLLAMHALDLDSRGSLPERTVVSTVMANLGLNRCFEERGFRLLQTKVGDRFVVEEMLRTGARLGGEPSGHIVFLDASPAGDGMLSMLLTLSLMRRSGKPLSELASVLKRYPMTLINVRVREKPPLAGVPAIEQARTEAERKLAGRGRIVLRYSGTEPLCRVMVEGPDETTVNDLGGAIAASIQKTIGILPP